jgi:putative flippase GtrA
VTGSQNGSYRQHGRVFGTFARFLLSGGFNTGVTYALYLVLLRFVPYKTSYTIAYITGIVISYFLNRSFVFRANRGLSTAAMFPLVYLVQYLAGLAIVSFWTGILGWNAAYAALPAILLTIPLTFALAHWIFAGKERPPAK